MIYILLNIIFNALFPTKGQTGIIYIEKSSMYSIFFKQCLNNK